MFIWSTVQTKYVQNTLKFAFLVFSIIITSPTCYLAESYQLHFLFFLSFQFLGILPFLYLLNYTFKKSTVQCIISSSKPLTCPLTSIFSSFVHRAIFLMFTNVRRVHWLFTHLPKNILQTSHLGIQHITKPNVKTKAKTNNSNNKKLFQPYCLHGSYISGPLSYSVNVWGKANLIRITSGVKKN